MDNAEDKDGRRPPTRWEEAVAAYADKFGEDQIYRFGFCESHTADEFERAVQSGIPIKDHRLPDGALS